MTREQTGLSEPKRTSAIAGPKEVGVHRSRTKEGHRIPEFTGKEEDEEEEENAVSMGISGWSESGIRLRTCSPTSHLTRPLLLLLVLLSLIGSAIVSAESFVSDPENEDTLILPGHEDHEDGDGGCDGGGGSGSRMRDESDGDRIYRAHGHELDDDSDGKFEKWDDHFAKERAKQKSAKGLIRSLSSSSVPHSRRGRFGFRDRSSSFASSFFRRRPKNHDRLSDLLLANHKDHAGEEFASDDDDVVTSDGGGSDIEDDSLMEPSDAAPFRSRIRHSNRRSHGRSSRLLHPASHHANDFRDFDDMRDYSSEEDAAVQEFINGGARNRGRHRNRSFFRPSVDDRTDHHSSINGRPTRRWRLFGG